MHICLDGPPLVSGIPAACPMLDVQPAIVDEATLGVGPWVHQSLLALLLQRLDLVAGLQVADGQLCLLLLGAPGSRPEKVSWD